MTQERNTKQAKMDENYTHMTNFKGRRQNLKEFVFQINFYGVIKSKSN